MSSEEEVGRKPNWVLLKEAAETLYRSGKVYFTRKELIEEAKRRDPTRSDMSLDFEIDLVTVNSSSKEKYRDPDKLFLYRVERGKYTLYNPEEHGELEKYVEAHRVLPARKRLLEEVMLALEGLGYDVSINRTTRPMEPDIVAERGEDVRVGVWLIDPSAPLSTQYRYLAYIIGSCMLNKNYTEHMVLIPGELYKRIPQEVVNVLLKFNTRVAILREERKYSIQL